MPRAKAGWDNSCYLGAKGRAGCWLALRQRARCLGNKLQSGGYLKSNNYTTLLYELIDLVKEMYNSTSRVT